MSAGVPVEAARPGRAGQRPRHHARSWTRTRRGIWAIRAVTLAIILVAWQIIGSNVSAALFVPPTAVAKAFWDLGLASPQLIDAILTSGRAFLLGYSAAILVGVTVGLVMGRSHRADVVLDPWVFFLYAIPSIALIPLLVLWFGIDDLVKIVLVFLSSVFTIIINTAAGVKRVDEEFVDVGRSSCANERQLMRTIILPAAFPYIFAGVRLALSQAIVGVIGAEFLVVITGLGGMILTAANYFQTAKMFVPILVIVAISMGLSALMNMLQRRIGRWEHLMDVES